MTKKRTVLCGQAREFVVRLRDYFEREQQNNGPLLPINRVVERVAGALDIGCKTVSRITREKFGPEGMSENKLSTPNKKRTKVDNGLATLRMLRVSIGDGIAYHQKKRARENADTYQSLFTKIRTQNDLHSTQVLHVGGGVSTSSQPMGSKGTSQVVGHNNKPKTEEIETVIIDDDNPQDNASTNTLSNKINQNPPPHVINNINPAPQPVNISMGSDSYVYIMPVNNVLPSGTIYLLPNAENTQSQPNIEVNKRDNYILPELSPKKPRKTEKIDDDIEIVTDDDCFKTESKLKERIAAEVVKLPIKKDSRVDWEDMIPMEVIACAEDKPINNSTLKDATQDLLKDLQSVINMGTK